MKYLTLMAKWSVGPSQFPDFICITSTRIVFPSNIGSHSATTLRGVEFRSEAFKRRMGNRGWISGARLEKVAGSRCRSRSELQLLSRK